MLLGSRGRVSWHMFFLVSELSDSTTVATSKFMQILQKYVHRYIYFKLPQANRYDELFLKKIKVKYIWTYLTETTHVVNQQQNNK